MSNVMFSKKPKELKGSFFCNHHILTLVYKKRHIIGSCLAFLKNLHHFQESLWVQLLSELHLEAQHQEGFPFLCVHTKEHLVTPHKFLNLEIPLLFVASLWHKQSTCSKPLPVSCHFHKMSNSKFHCYQSSL